MRRLLVAVTLALSLLGAAQARTLELVENAHELSLRYVTMPGSTAGTVIFRKCQSCEPMSSRVTSATRYFIRDNELALADFLAAVDSIRDGEPESSDPPVSVYYNRETGAITRIKVFYGP